MLLPDGQHYALEIRRSGRTVPQPENTETEGDTDAYRKN